MLKLDRAIACDLAEDVAATSRFVIVDDFEIRGGGIVREALPDRQACGARPGPAPELQVGAQHHPARAAGREVQPEGRAHPGHRRARAPTGRASPRRSRGKLFDDGKVVYFLGIGNVLYGVDADIERKQENRLEHMRRLAEVANLMLDAGIILVVAAAELTQDDLEVIKTAVQPDWIETIWAGDTHHHRPVRATCTCPAERCRRRWTGSRSHLQDKGIIFRPW